MKHLAAILFLKMLRHKVAGVAGSRQLAASGGGPSNVPERSRKVLLLIVAGDAGSRLLAASGGRPPNVPECARAQPEVAAT